MDPSEYQDRVVNTVTRIETVQIEMARVIAKVPDLVEQLIRLSEQQDRTKDSLGRAFTRIDELQGSLNSVRRELEEEKRALESEIAAEIKEIRASLEQQSRDIQRINVARDFLAWVGPAGIVAAVAAAVAFFRG